MPALGPGSQRFCWGLCRSARSPAAQALAVGGSPSVLLWAQGRVQAGSGGCRSCVLPQPGPALRATRVPVLVGSLAPAAAQEGMPWSQLQSAQSVWIVCSFPKFKCDKCSLLKHSLRTWSPGAQSSSGFSSTALEFLLSSLPGSRSAAQLNGLWVPPFPCIPSMPKSRWFWFSSWKASGDICVKGER